ncbi:MPN527 family putative ECF transporter permease subunit [Mesomycoplasma conjunctivae]|uniref:MPN527 family putative ECF transporter permease subunit n=1 Tax=Mesomycoplasma conjunctivae TaxID=45361 RepID=UPI003DA667BB
MKSLYYKNNLTFKLSITGILLSISLLALYFSHTLLNWPIFTLGLKVDLSTLFILPIFMVSGIYFGILALIIRFVLGPFIIFQGIESTSLQAQYFSHFIFLLSSIIFLFTFTFLDWIANKKDLQAKKNKKKLFLHLLISVLTTTFLMSILNGFWITPTYFYIFRLTESSSYFATLNKWSQIADNFGAKNFDYWGFIALAYIPFNLLNFAITSLLSVPLYFVITNFFKKNGK